ncbi:hypothetical protein [Bradyrhizobium roseum]|uniref:hypothetical protein n=1 Tax=Bradyrhizobium roseum TaxID=3056648 RepID=UPI002635554A|nr:hypothetical protein [Bradyrhizobium roseus]WKA27398.1 hypothetical protein QUH67_28070 [Bradyrhizobium roseus]
MRVAHRGRWTYRDWTRWNFLWKYFPWYAREMRYRGDFCIGQGCMHWFWENPDTKERGYCSAAVSRTQHMMWATELEEARGLPGQLGQNEQVALLPNPAGNAPPRRTNALRTVAGIAAWSAVIGLAVYWLW